MSHDPSYIPVHPSYNGWRGVMWRFSRQAAECNAYTPIKIELIRVTYLEGARNFEGGNFEIAANRGWSPFFYYNGLFHDNRGNFQVDVEFRFKSGRDIEPCECAPRPDRDTQSGAPPPPHPYSTLSEDLAALYERMVMPDVRFLFGNDSLPAHEWVLRARVPYFDRLFTSGMREAETKEIEVQDADIASFSHALKFIYCAQPPTDMKTEAANLLPIAEKYGIDQLKQICVGSLRENLRQENVVATLILADVHQCPELKQFCITKLAEWNGPEAETDLDLLDPYPHLMKETLKFLFRQNAGSHSRTVFEPNLLATY